MARQLKTVDSSDSSTMGGSSGLDFLTARKTGTGKATTSSAAHAAAVEKQIEYSKRHWSQLTEPDSNFAEVAVVVKDKDLRSLIDRNMAESGRGYGPPFPKEKAEEIMYRIALEMERMHKNNVVHRDLRASSVLVRNYANGNYEAYVPDSKGSNGVAGTGFFRAPEILQARKEKNALGKQEFTRADVYSYGMTSYEILTGKLPFEHHPLSGNVSLLTDLVIKGLRPEVPDFVDSWARELLQKCWQSDPSARPSFREILSIIETNSNSEFIRTTSSK